MEEKEGKERNLVAEGLMDGVWFGLTSALIAGVGSLIYTLTIGWLPFILIAFFFGFAIGFLYGIVPRNYKALAGIGVILACIGLLFLSANILQAELKPIEEILPFEITGIIPEELLAVQYCLRFDPRCLGGSLENPDVTINEEGIAIDVDFSDKKVENGYFDMLVELKVKNNFEQEVNKSKMTML